jgi:hypothetical protein
VDAGSAIAEELLNGAGNILKANELVAEVQGIADLVANNSAAKFYGAGVLAGQNLVAGVQSVIDSFEIRLNTPGLTAKQVKAMRGQFAASAPVATPSVAFDFGLGGIMAGIPFMAEGGIIANGAQLAVIGESGPEAVIPLDRMGDFNGGSTNVTINVQGGDPEAIVDALRRYMFRNGTVPIKVSA